MVSCRQNKQTQKLCRAFGYFFRLFWSPRIAAPTDGATFQQGDAITFTATATDAQDGDLSAVIFWTATVANNPSAVTQLGTGASVSTSSLAPGAYLITASATDSGNLTGIAQAGITVNSPCSVVASFTPASAVRLPQLLQLDATASYDTCGRPLKYDWGCTSGTSTYCQTFLQVANNGGNYNNPFPLLDLQPEDLFTITLSVCTASSNECAPTLVRQYIGAVVGN